MCRLVTWVSRTPRTLADVLGETALDRLLHLSTVHADGWGAAWHDDDGALVTQHSPVRAGADEAFRAFAVGLSTKVALVHLRLGTPGYGRGAGSTHPFVDGEYALGHNGAILPGTRIHALLDGSGRRALGPTDSERYFLALRDAMDRHDGVVASAVDDVVSRIAAAGLGASSLNALMLVPDAVHVISRHDADWRAADIPVWPADLLPSAPAYFPMSWRVDDESVTVVSSGIVDPGAAWRALPNDAVLRIDATTLATTLDLLEGPRVRSARLR